MDYPNRNEQLKQRQAAAVLTFEQFGRALQWLDGHTEYVNRITQGIGGYPPTNPEDKNNPSAWKAAHWAWFLDNF